MPAVLHDATVMQCPHQGAVEATPSTSRVSIEERPVLTQDDALAIVGCTLSPSAGGPCLTAVFSQASSKVKVQGKAVLLHDGAPLCEPTKMPLAVKKTQARVTAK